jgi:voltage-gated potassium channel Kch
MLSVLSLWSIGCADPLKDPAFEPVSADPEVVLALTPDPGWRVGGPLEATLEVTSLARGARYDESVAGGRGRPHHDTWTVRPADGVRDPSRYWQDILARVDTARGGVRGGETASIDLYPQHYAQFTAPGTYAVQLATTRIDDTRYVLPPFLIQVGPRDPAADEAAFTEAMAAIDGNDRVAQQEAFRRLFALGNDATLARAAAEVVKPDADPWWATLLLAHPDEAGVERALEAILTDPAAPVTPHIVHVLSARAYDERVERPLGMRPSRDDSEAVRLFEVGVKERRERMLEIEREVAGRIVGHLAAKQEGFGETLAVVTNLAFRQDQIPWRATWMELLRTRLDELPEATLQQVLVPRWNEVAHPSTAEPLARIAATSSRLGDLALRRLRTVDDARFRPVALERLRTGAVATEIGQRALAEVDDVPEEVVASLLDAIVADPDQLYLLRLAVPLATVEQTAQQLGQAFDALPDDAPVEVLGAYAAAFHQHGLRRKEVERLLDAIDSRRAGLLPEMARNHPRPEELLPAAMEAITAESGAMNLAAAEVLAEYGTPDFRPTLNRALIGANPSQQTAIVIALFTARNWTINKADKERLAKLVKERRALHILDTVTIRTDAMVRLAGRLEDGEPVLTVNQRDYVGREAILTKLKQLYPGAPVKIEYSGVDTEAASVALEQIAVDAGLAIYVLDEVNQAEPVEPTP